VESILHLREKKKNPLYSLISRGRKAKGKGIKEFFHLGGGGILLLYQKRREMLGKKSETYFLREKGGHITLVTKKG